MGDRYYDPTIGRFISPDPLGLAGGLNLYAYAGEGAENDLDALLDAFRKHGRDILVAEPGTDDERYLNAMALGGVAQGPTKTGILLPHHFTKNAALEEFLHGTQWKLGIYDRLGEIGGAAEVHAREFMIRHQRLLGLSEADLSELVPPRNRGWRGSTGADPALSGPDPFEVLESADGKAHAHGRGPLPIEMRACINPTRLADIHGGQETGLSSYSQNRAARRHF